MSMLDQLLGGIGGQLLSQLGGNQQNMLMQAVMGLIQQPGGLQGLVDKFQQAGLGNQMSSWVSTGQNLPIEGSQLQQVLGGDWLSQLASQLGTSQEQASGSVASVLPQLIDQLTPNGRLSDVQSMLQGGGLESLLKGRLFG